jgi:hypothetical protein
MQSRATWNLGTNSAFALGPRKTTEILDRVGPTPMTSPIYRHGLHRKHRSSVDVAFTSFSVSTQSFYSHFSSTALFRRHYLPPDICLFRCLATGSKEHGMFEYRKLRLERRVIVTPRSLTKPHTFLSHL